MPDNLVTMSMADALNAAAVSNVVVKSRLDNHVPRDRERFPARLTGFDSVTRNYSWVEQWYDSTGARVDLTNGRTGSTSYGPAKAIGTNEVVQTFPTEVMLRKVMVSETYGPVYEFPWYCACDQGGYSGSGSGSGSGGGICCPVSPTDVLTASISDLGGLCSGCTLPFDFTMAYGIDGQGAYWSGLGLFGFGGTCPDFIGLVMRCVNGLWTLSCVTGTGYLEFATVTSNSGGLCNPFYETFTITPNAGYADCTGSLSITISSGDYACCAVSITTSTTLYATFSGLVDVTCSGMAICASHFNGLSIAMTWDVPNNSWIGDEVFVCGSGVSLELIVGLQCNGGALELSWRILATSGSTITAYSDTMFQPATTCNPFDLTTSEVTTACDLSTTTVTIHVTE